MENYYLDRIDINGQIILRDNQKAIINWDTNYNITETKDNLISLTGVCSFDTEKEIIKDIIEKTKNLKIFSGIIEIRSDNYFFIMIYNILKGKWDIQKNNFI